jgi:LSD1 subclass zinc finger protein
MESGELKLLCSGCGASLEYSAGARALKCVYCAAVTEIPRASEDEIDATPDHIVTLVVTRNQLEDAVFQHLAEGKYTPDNLLEHATFTKVEQFFVPAYAFTGKYEANWTASFGYNRTEHYTDFVKDSRGNSQAVSRTRTVTDWRPVNGSDSGGFSVLTYGGSRLLDASLDLTTRLVERCQMKGDLADYSASFTSGFEVEAYSQRPNEAYGNRGEALVNAIIDQGVKQHAQGDSQKDWHWTASTKKNASRVLIPVCHIVYEYQGKAYNVWTDGTSTANLVADAGPEDHGRRRAVRYGFIPALAGVAAFAGVAATTNGQLSALPEVPLMWAGLIGSIAYGVLRRRSILSYSLKLRHAILAQRKMAATNTANVDEAERARLMESCKRPDRPWLAGTMKDSVILPLASVAALAFVLTPRLHEQVRMHAQEVEVTATAAPAVETPVPVTDNPAQPETLAQAPATQPATMATPEPQQTVAAVEASVAPPPAPPVQVPAQIADTLANTATPAQVSPIAHAQVSVPVPVVDVLSAAAQNDWSSVDTAADRLRRTDLASAAPRDRATARAANIEGKAALGVSNYFGAVDAFRRGVAADPADIEIQNNLGFAYEEAGRQQEAIDVVTDVLTRSPRRSSAWANLASSLAESGHLPEAEAALSIAVHYTSNRDRSLAFLQEQAAGGRSDAIKQVSMQVSQRALDIPIAMANTAKISTATLVPPPTPALASREAPSKGDQAYIRSINQQLEQQLKDLGTSK